MTKLGSFPVLVLAAACLVSQFSLAQTLAPTPPLGWNSWDAYGFTIDEQQFRDNATVLVSLEQFGWKYAVIDEGWYMANPAAAGKAVEQKQYLWNNNGLLIPVPARYPSAADGAGFKPLADWLHSHGLKFGIHIVRGIPKQVVAANLPIAGTQFHAADAADTTSPCPWDEGNWGIKDNAAGQAYYDSMLKLYAHWGLDFLKVDCISNNPYRPTEIRQIAEAIRKTGRPIILSLSPGPTDITHAAEVAKYAQMWRITDDHWDKWSFENKPGDEYPFGLQGEFDRLAKWFVYTGPGNWPDPDMLPEGWLGPHPGMGEPRQSRLTPDEQRTEFTLWCVTRSPLILGGNLTRLDDFTRSLVTNQALLFVDQNASYSRPVDASALGAGFENVRVWRATIEQPGARGYAEFFAFFNLGSSPATVRTTWKDLGLDNQKHSAQNAWDDSTTKESKDISLTLPPHGSALYQVSMNGK
ncbi:MAG: glycoside hydrolase family 27 protein [Terracidiphilus sp.]|nr:glycoside hydrolase family 27 protein [Terracidiphilus sp.]MDR3796561.1 glycoside hydrolase family 27 protein [Terracidiphilus sp.]